MVSTTEMLSGKKRAEREKDHEMINDERNGNDPDDNVDNVDDDDRNGVDIMTKITYEDVK